jgi:peptidoglycan/xylan/chitin deacetylase (PgdA/CDA1 family)
MFIQKSFLFLSLFLVGCSSAQTQSHFPAMAQKPRVGHTEIMKWQNGKTTAVSITYDGGTINQFRVALPIMNEMGFKATFFIVTGDITGSKFQGKFLGRPVEDILKESAKMPINKGNFFERATALRYLDYEGARECHTRAGDLFELGKFDEAYREIDDAYAKIHRGEMKPLDQKVAYDNPTVDISWDELRRIATQGHEFGSHSITHPQPAICDDLNLRYELEKSREELLNQLGTKHAFSAECPHGSENKRVMDCALSLYCATRNRMPEPFLEEINRWNKKDPTLAKKEYVQWQRGPTTSTTLEQMKAWVDVCLAHDNFWLVLTFHGIDGIGYQPKTGEEIKGFFSYIKAHEDRIWVATFQDVTKYMRERMNGSACSAMEGERIKVVLTHSLDPNLYALPLTLKTYVPSGWKSVSVKQADTLQRVPASGEQEGVFVLYQAMPNAAPVELSKGN